MNIINIQLKEQDYMYNSYEGQSQTKNKKIILRYNLSATISTLTVLG